MFLGRVRGLSISVDVEDEAEDLTDLRERR
jgi:hypothetical protein